MDSRSSKLSAGKRKFSGDIVNTLSSACKMVPKNKACALSSFLSGLGNIYSRIKEKTYMGHFILSPAIFKSPGKCWINKYCFP